VNRRGAAAGTDGIVVAAGGFTAPPAHVRITGNRVHDRSGTGIALRTAVRTWIVKENVVANAGAGIAVQGNGSAEHAAVDNNEVLDVVAAAGADAAVGILLLGASSAIAVGNTVARVGLALEEAGARAGIAVLASADARVSDNVVSDIGPPGGFVGNAVGIAVVGPFNAASVSDNSSRFSSEQNAPTQGDWHALMIRSAGGIVRFGSAAMAVAVGDGAVMLTNDFAFVAPARPDHTAVASNMLTGGGSLPTCLVQVRGDVVAQGNQCDHEGTEPAGIQLQGTSITASTNRVRGDKAMLILVVPENRFAAVGNLTAGGTRLGSPTGALPPPWEPLNPIVP
jgi:hypothetical protein